MKSVLWPNLSKHLNISKDKIQIDPSYLLLLIEEKHPNTIDAKFLKKNWQTEAIFCAENLELFAHLLVKVDKINIINHPIYVYFVKRLIETKFLKEFWIMLDSMLTGKISKITEMIAINAAITILKHSSEKPKEVLKLFTPNFLKMINERGVKIDKDEDFIEMYKEFFELLDQQLQGLKRQDMKLQAFRAFTQLSVEKNSPKKFITNIINSLELDTLKVAVDHIKSVIVGNGDEKERQYAATVLQRTIVSNKAVSNDIEWRTEQQVFFANLAFLKCANGVDVTKDEKPNSIAPIIRNLFYHTLESKFTKMDDEKKVLLGIVQHLTLFLNKKKDSKEFFQKPLEQKYVDCWNRMLNEAAKSEKKDKNLKLVFHILMLHMAIQLFNNPELAENAISELEAVMERAMLKNKKRDEDEPEWIEVVVDLFLTLLSQESSVLRNVIRHVFPQLCNQISVTAFNQILSMLDIRSKDNPLTIGESDDEDDEENDIAGDDEESGIEEEMDIDESEEEVSDFENNSEEEDVEGFSDTVRLAVQKALEENMENGSDIDVDQISPEEGKRLNISLGNAFKMLIEHRNLNSKKKTKSVKLADKALLHFRMRVLDLVEIYLKNNPQMEICLEILVFFYDLMPFAFNDPQFYQRFEKIFAQLGQLKTFSLETVQNVTQKNLADIFSRILEKLSKEKINVQQQPYFKNACTFMIYASHILQSLTPEEDDEMLRIVLEKLRSFLSQRNPVLQVITFTKILTSQWPGNFKLAKMIADEGLKPEIRALRRTQSLQMLLEFFKNSNIFRQHEKKATKYYGKICEHLKAYMDNLKEISQSEFLELISFTMYVRNVKAFEGKSDLLAAIQKFRKCLVLKSNILNAYKSLCKVMNIEFISNEKIDQSSISNGGVQQELTNGQQNGKGAKRKKKTNQKEKKLKRMKELEEASKGLDTNFSFV